MKTALHALRKSDYQPWLSSFPFWIALVVILFIGWTIFNVIGHPDDGILYLHPTGVIGEIDLNGPAYGRLQTGDIVASIDGIPWQDFSAYPGKSGDLVEFVVIRDGLQIPVTYRLATPELSDIFFNLSPLFIALLFWGIGLGVVAFKPAGGIGDLFSAWSQACAITLTAGTASSLGPDWTSNLFGIALWIIGPLSVHFHVSFPQPPQIRRRRILIIGLYIIGAIGSLPYLLSGSIEFRALPWYPLHVSAGRLFLGLNLLLVVLLQVINYHRTDYPGARASIRLVALGLVLAATPFIALTVLPDALFQQPILSFQVTFLWMGIIPVTYGYAIFRLHLIEIEHHINRGASYILVYSILGACYLILYALLERFLPPEMASTPLINTLLVLVLASIFFPLSGRIHQFVDQVFYGGWYDYRSGLLKITQDLDQITNLDRLASELANRLLEVFRLEECCVFLRDHDGEFSVVHEAVSGGFREHYDRNYPALPRSSLTYLLRVGVIERNRMRQLINEVTLTEEELKLLNSEQINLWAPVIGRGIVQGLLALGPKLGGDMFSSEDLDIVRSVVLQTGPLVESIQLFSRLKKHAEELEHRVVERTAELYDAKERVEAILASVGDGVIVTDLDWKIITVNTAFEKQSYFQASEITGSDMLYLFGDENKPALIESMQDKLHLGGVWNGELITRRKDGQGYDAHLTIAPVRDQSGKIVYYVGSLRDITKQKELERMKDAFIADVSHELRTPITNIRLYLDLLDVANRTTNIEKRNRYLAVINEQSQLLSTMVEDILDLSRLTRDKLQPVEQTEIDLNLFADQSVTANQPLADASGIELRLEHSPGSLLIRGDQILIARLINNLVSNAVRYTPEGCVWVRTRRLESCIQLEVEDTGMGIDPDDLEYIFKRFYRGSNIRHSGIPGTGLGLAIVNEIIDIHQGQIEVHSEPGKGSTFIVSLPPG